MFQLYHSFLGVIILINNAIRLGNSGSDLL